MTKYRVSGSRTDPKNLAVGQGLQNNHNTNHSFILGERHSGLFIRYIAQFGAHSFVVAESKVILYSNRLENILSSRTEIYYLIFCANVKFWRSEVRDSSVLWTFRIGLLPGAKEIVANLDDAICMHSDYLPFNHYLSFLSTFRLGTPSSIPMFRH